VCEAEKKKIAQEPDPFNPLSAAPHILSFFFSFPGKLKKEMGLTHPSRYVLQPALFCANVFGVLSVLEWLYVLADSLFYLRSLLEWFSTRRPKGINMVTNTKITVESPTTKRGKDEKRREVNMELIQYYKLDPNIRYYHFNDQDDEIHAYHTKDNETHERLFNYGLSIMSGTPDMYNDNIFDHVKEIAKGKFPLKRSRTIAGEKITLTLFLEDDIESHRVLKLARTIFLLNKLL